MKKKITIVVLGILMMMNPVIASEGLNTVPVRFLHNITSRDINPGDAIPLEIIHDIYLETSCDQVSTSGTHATHGSDLLSSDITSKTSPCRMSGDGHKIFAQGGAGYAYVDEVKKARWLGRGGKLSISRGVVVDVMGKTHNVILSNDAKGEFSLTPAAGALSLGAVSSDILEIGGRRGSISGTMLGVGAGLGAVSLLMGKGNEATIGRGKVMFAHLASPITVAQK